IPDFGPDFGFSNGTLVLGLLAILAVVFVEYRIRTRQAKIGATQAPLWVSFVKVGATVVVIIFATYLFATGRVGTSFPVPGIVLVLLVLLYSFITNNTIVGRHIYAVGGNWHAAELSGVKIKRVNFFVMLNMSVLAAVAGMIGVARAGASGPGDGTGWELDAIAAVFIGGAAVAGGIGTIVGSIVGGLVIAVLNNGLQLLGVSNDRVQIIKGLVLLLAVGIDVYSKRSGRPSLIGLLTRKRSPMGPDDPDVSGTAPLDRQSVEPDGNSAEASSRSQSTTPDA
ncbi:MAG: sugar ABC transporter permease, partial [Lacisediminihabitans sp.]